MCLPVYSDFAVSVTEKAFSQIFCSLQIGRENIGDFIDGDIGLRIDLMYQIFHPPDLETIYHKIDHRLIGIGIIAFRIDNGHPVFKGFGECSADFFLFCCDNERRFGAVEALHKEIYGLGSGGVGYDGIEGQDPAPHHNAADDIQKHVVDHHETSEAYAQAFGKHHPQDVNAVDGAAEPHGEPAAAAGDDAPEDSAQKQIRLREGRSDGHIHRQDIRDDPRSHGIYEHGVDGVDGECRTLLFQPEQKDRDIEQDQDQ